MYKYLIALAFLSGSFASYAETDYKYNDTTSVNDSSRSSVGDNYNGENYYEDTSSTKSSATSREEERNYPSASASSDQRVTGTMPDFSREGLIAQKWHAGILSGVSDPKNGKDTSAAFGVDIGYQPAEHFGAGIEAITAKQKDSNDFQRTTTLIKGTFHLGGDLPVLNTAYLGAGAGPVFISNKVNWAAAPMVGFDVPLSSKTSDFLSLGLNARYVITSDAAETPNEFLSAVALKYWF